MFFPYGTPAIFTLGSAIENEADDDDSENSVANSINDQLEIENSTSSTALTNGNGISPISTPISENSTPTSTTNRKLIASPSPSSILVVSSNRERLIVAVLTLKSLFLYSSNPQTLLVAYTRTKKSISEKGYNEKLIWKPDSTSIAITTSKDYLLIFKVDLDAQSSAYEMLESRPPVYKRDTLELIVQQRIPKARLSPATTVRLASKASSLVTLKEEIIVGLCNGWLHRLLWNGHVMEDYSVSIAQIPFFYELESKPEYLKTRSGDPSAYLVNLVYSPLIGGFGFVLSNGRAGLLTAQSPRYHPTELRAIWAPSIQDAVCCAANHKYRLLAFGRKNSTITSYNVDETSGALVQAYQVQLTNIDNPSVSSSSASSSLGPVRHLEWSPYGTTLGCAWSLGGVGGFSVFGSQLWFEFTAEMLPCFDWGTEGYQLWMAGSRLKVWQCVRPANVNNSAVGHNKRLTLISADSLYLSPLRSLEAKVYAPMQSYWQRISVPWNYIGHWWPIRYCALDDAQEGLAIAGTRGFVHCQLHNQKWRLFGNETQEKDMTVTGGLCFWREFIAIGCYDIEKQTDEMRFYPRWSSLDNANCSRISVESQVLFFNIRHDVLLTFDVDAKCILYSMKIDRKSTSANNNNNDQSIPQVRLERCAEILVNDLVPHPACVISAQLIARGGDDGAAKFCDDVDAILLNIAGRLIMLSPQSIERRSGASSSSHHPQQSQDGPVQNQLEPPLLVASYVEEVWVDLQWQQSADGAQMLSSDKPHLSQALWIQCGCRGMRVWMPLFPRNTTGGTERYSMMQPQQQQFISKRIMLPFELSNMHALAVSSSECLVVGIEACFSNGAASVHRKNEVFLHHILRQLLRRNLGFYALEIAGTCRNLKYFPHVLELLLHSVLEEEATSSEPIPDPLLPRVVAFLQEFPEFLQTIAHCARKTEMALWKHLFQTVGSPKDLFEVCIREKQLETAASYFIILQNMESSFSCKHHATMLLEAALDNGKTMIANEIVRFLKALDPEDLESPPITPLMFNKQPNFPRLPMMSPTNTDETDALVFQGPHPIMRQRHSSIGNSLTSPNDGGGTSNADGSSGGGTGGGSGSIGGGTTAPTFGVSRKSSGKQQQPTFYQDTQQAMAIMGASGGSGGGGGRKQLTKTVSSIIDGAQQMSTNGGVVYHQQQNDVRRVSVGSNHADAYINMILTKHTTKERAAAAAAAAAALVKTPEEPTTKSVSMAKLNNTWPSSSTSMTGIDRNSNKSYQQSNGPTNGSSSSTHTKENNGTIPGRPMGFDGRVEDDDEHPLVSAMTPTSADGGTNCSLM